MARDYFQDIVPPEESRKRTPVHHADDIDDEVTPIPIHEGSDQPVRSIRNISAPQRQRSRFQDGGRPVPSARGRGPRSSKMWLWVLASVCVLVLAAILLVAFRPTRVTVEARAHALTFAGENFTAYPQASAPASSLVYSVHTVELEDSEVVPSDGVVYAEDKASGNITVYNNYQTTPLKLVKNTRFAAANGVVFRAPSEIVVPGKRGSTPGKVEITVVADVAGEDGNVAPGRFTLPGLRSTPEMYSKVYAESTAAFTGGFKGERPGVAEGALESAISTVRARLEKKARESSAGIPENSFAFVELAQISYQSLPNTTEAGGGVRIHQKATVSIPLFSAPVLIGALGSSALGGTEPSMVKLIPGDVFAAAPVGTSTVVGVGPLTFALTGSAQLVWMVDEGELQVALAGKDKSAFETVVGGFTSIEEASARIEPFLQDSFPADPSEIKITVKEPQSAE